MTAPAHTLPGDVPGLLQRGSPVVLTDHGAAAGLGPGVVVELDDPLIRCAFTTHPMRWVDSVQACYIALDLTDPTGRVHALWWYLQATNVVQRLDLESGLPWMVWDTVVASVRTGGDLTPDDLDAFTRVLRAAAEVRRG